MNWHQNVDKIRRDVYEKVNKTDHRLYVTIGSWVIAIRIELTVGRKVF